MVSSINNMQPQMMSQGMQGVEGQRPPPPPRGEGQGGMPPGLESAISTLSDDQQSLTQQMLQQLSPDQRDQLKSALDAFKDQAQSMTDSERGAQFFSMLSDIYQSKQSNTDNEVNVYV